MAAVTEPGDNGHIPLIQAERARIQPARQKASETLPTCSSCGARLQPDLRQRGNLRGDGLCWSCWIKTPAGLEAERLRGKRARARARRFREWATQGGEGQC